MNLKLLFRCTFPLILFLLYTGCGRKAGRFIYMPPNAILFTNQVAVPASSVVPLDRLNIQLSMNMQEIQTAFNNYIPGSQVYATTIKEPIPIVLEKLRDIRIRPVYDYNSRYRALDDISHTCTFSYSHSGEDSVSKQDILEDFTNAEFAFYGLNHVYIHFNEPPGAYHVQQFVVELITESNTILGDTTVEFILTP